MKRTLLAFAIHTVLMAAEPGASGGGRAGKVSVPGAPDTAPGSDTLEGGDTAAGADTQPGSIDPEQQAMADRVAALEAENRRLVRLNAQLQGGQGASSGLIEEGGGPNTRRAKAESKHLHLTSTELDKLVRSGKVRMTDHHVLCKDGWYVNPAANVHANG